MRATIEMQQQDYAGMASDLSVLVRDNPNDVNAREMRGIAYVRLGQYDKAAADFLRVEEVYGPAVTRLDEVCIALSHSSKPDKAIEPCKRIVANNPYSTVARNGLGIAYFRQGEYQKAISQLRSASRTFPSNAEYLYAVGATESKLGETADGKRDMARAENMAPGIGRKLQRFGIVP